MISVTITSMIITHSLALMLGVFLGVFVIGVFASNSYQKGREDLKKELTHLEEVSKKRS